VGSAKRIQGRWGRASLRSGARWADAEAIGGAAAKTPILRLELRAGPERRLDILELLRIVEALKADPRKVFDAILTAKLGGRPRR
jgi:hypothetical protein